MAEIKVVLADDHVIVRNGIKALLENNPEIHVIAEASNGKEALDVCSQLHPDVLILDIRMPEMNGIEAAKLLPEYSSGTRSLILSMHDLEEYVLQAVESGANGYLLKDTSKEEFIKAIHKVYLGEKYFSSDISNVFINKYLNNKVSDNKTVSDESVKGNDFDLTRREIEILKYIVDGLSNKEISEKLGKSIRTIENHRFSIMKKLDVHNAIELMNTVKNYDLLN